jgi:hypothetical protein
MLMSLLLLQLLIVIDGLTLLYVFAYLHLLVFIVVNDHCHSSYDRTSIQGAVLYKVMTINDNSENILTNAGICPIANP